MTVAAHWMWGTHGRVEVDETGNIQMAVRAAGNGGRTDHDGYARADVSDVSVLQDLLGRARMFAQAVFPPASPGRPDLEFTWQERADAYRLLEFNGKLLLRSDDNAKVVTEFLHDWKREQGQLGRAGIPEEMDAFAERWERWWYLQA